MPKTVIEASIRLSIESAWELSATNPYTSLPSVMTLAKIAVRNAEALDSLGGFVSFDGKELGYGLAQVRPLFQLLLPRLPADEGRAACECLERISDSYEEACQHCDAEEKAHINRLFTAAVSEAIVHELLIRSGRPENEIAQDVHFALGTEPLTPCNIDHVWVVPASRQIELYECKNYPADLFDFYSVREDPSYTGKWQEEKLYLMLEVRRLLHARDWYTHAGCITLRSRHTTERALRRRPLPPDDELTVYFLEDLTGGSFPPPLPN